MVTDPTRRQQAGLRRPFLLSTALRAVRFPAMVVIAASLGSATPTGVARADVLVTKDGERIETRGAWSVKGRQIVFTSATGTLSAVRLDDIDLAASEAATEKALAPPPAPESAPATRPSPRRPPVLTITDADIPRRAPAIGSAAERLIGRLRSALELQDIDAAMATVHLEGTTPAVRQSLRDVFAKLIARPVRSVTFEPVDDGGPETTVHGGVSYAPNKPVLGRMKVVMEPTVEDGDADAVEATFFVGEHLGDYVLVAPEVVPGAPPLPEVEATETDEAAPSDQEGNDPPGGDVDRPGGDIDRPGG